MQRLLADGKKRSAPVPLFRQTYKATSKSEVAQVAVLIMVSEAHAGAEDCESLIDLELQDEIGGVQSIMTSHVTRI